MEWIGPLLIGSLVLLCVLQLFWAHTISAIAEKTDQTDLMQVLAWIPILQIAPTLAAGGSGVGRFLLGTIAVLMGNGALITVGAFLGGSLGSLMATVGIGLSCGLCLFYFGRIAVNTALARDLPGWLGLLLFVPIVNFFIYPYIAFHDGWVGPNKIGLAIGSVLILGSSAQTFQAVQNLNEIGGLSPDALLAIAKGEPTDPAGLGGIQAKLLADLRAPDPRTSQASQDPATSREAARLEERQQASLRVLYQLKTRFDTLDSLTANTLETNDPRRPQALGIIRSVRADLDRQRIDLDPKTYSDLDKHLLEFEGRLQAPQSKSFFARVDSAVYGPDLDRQIGPAAIGMKSDFPTASYGDRLTSPTRPTRPFPVHASESCPAGTERQESKQAHNELEWCQQLAAYGGLRHGWYAKYLEDGQPESMGQYENGLRVGVWTRFYPTGEVRAQAEFQKGMQHGWVLTFDKMGEPTRSARYEYGMRITAE
jgi:hypothetical protein